MSEVIVITPSQRVVSAVDATSGMVRETVADVPGLWVGYVRTEPAKPSGWHHHGTHETYFFVESGSIRMEFGPGGDQSVEARPGDFVHVPPGLIHREVNSSSQPGTLILFRVGEGDVVVNVEGPEA
ncbi:MAG TPA: cupin domain-containing protein [Acidimicrobiia bacterium]|nr:cupin domain-containing protein [Acidimicrobiia bacterium]